MACPSCLAGMPPWRHYIPTCTRPVCWTAAWELLEIWQWFKRLSLFFFFFLIASVTAKHISFRAEEEKMSLKPDKMVSLWLASFIWWKISLVMLVLLAVFPLTPVISQHELETISETSFLTLHHFPPQKDIYFFCSRSLGSAISMFSCIHSILCACDTLLCLWVFRVWKPAVICKHVFRIGKWGGVGSKHFTACCAEKI